MFITGMRGRGKTTLLKALFPEPLPGLTTWAEPGKAVFLCENLTGHRVQVGVFDPCLPGGENKMVLHGDGFETFGVPALGRCMASESQWVTLDEIGYLEAKSELYCGALGELLEKKRVAAVIRRQKLPFLEELCAREDAFVADLDAPFENVGCVIMASGMGKRFGGNKLMADFMGKPMIVRALEASEGLKGRRVVVTRHGDVAELCRERGVDTVLHGMPHRNDTVRLGLEFLGNMEGCLFLPGDQPLLRRETVDAMVVQWNGDRSAVIRPFCGGTPGSPVLFPRRVFPELMSLPEGKGGGWVIKQHPELVRAFSVDDPYELTDADTPEVLEQLRQRADSGRCPF